MGTWTLRVGVRFRVLGGLPGHRMIYTSPDASIFVITTLTQVTISQVLSPYKQEV